MDQLSDSYINAEIAFEWNVFILIYTLMIFDF